MNIIEGHGPEVALFNTPPTNTAIEKAEWMEYRPVSQLQSNSAVEFYVSGAGSHYFDLRKTRLRLSLKLIKSDGSTVAENDKVGLINLPHASIFSQVDVTLQQKPITRMAQPHYAYIAYLETLLNTSAEAKQTLLTSQMWVKDTPGAMDGMMNIEEGTYPNAGLAERWDTTKSGQILTMEGNLHVDFFQQNRYLLNGVALQLKLWQASEQFRLMTTNEGYHVCITDAVLLMNAVTVNPEVILAHNAALEKSPALYPYTKTDIKTYSIGQGQYSFTAENLYQGDIPSKLYVGFTSAAGYNGQFNKNPFNFQHFDLNFLGFYVDGKSRPRKPLEPNYAEHEYTDGYLSLFTTNGMFDKKLGNGLTMVDYDKGYALYGFDIDCQDCSDYLPMSKKGHTRIDVKFAKALPESVNMIVYGHFPAVIKVDIARSVYS